MRSPRLRTPPLLLVGLLFGVSACGPGAPAGRRVAHRLVPLPVAGADPARLTARPAAPRFEVRTDGETSRPAALLEGAATELRWPVELPPRATLELRHAVRPGDGARAPVRLTVALEHPDGSRQALWTRTLAEAELDDAPREEVVSVAAEGSGTLVLESHAEAGAPVVSWIAPVLVGETDHAPPNVIVVCVDTLRADRFEAFGGARSVMPRMEARLTEGTRFTDGYANSPWSLPSMATIFTGRLPATHSAGRRTDGGPAEVATDWNARPVDGGIELVIAGRIRRFQTLHDSVPTLNEVLGARGYATAAIHANGYINPPTRALKGADESTYYASLDAADGTDRAIAYFERRRGQPFYLFLHYIDPHQWPWALPEELKTEDVGDFDAEERARVLETYDELCAYTDLHVDRLFAHLEASGLLESSLVFFVSDHGERFFERGVRGSHGGCQLESVLRVPFALWAPDRAPGVVETRVSLVDVAPTVYDFLGVPAPPGLDGASLLPLLEDPAAPDRRVIAEFVMWSAEESALLDGRWKLIRCPDTRDELYDLSDDRGDARDLAGAQPALAARLAQELDAHQARGRAVFEALTYGAAHLDPATLRSLQDLGYVGGDDD